MAVHPVSDTFCVCMCVCVLLLECFVLVDVQQQLRRKDNDQIKQKKSEHIPFPTFSSINNFTPTSKYNRKMQKKNHREIY